MMTAPIRALLFVFIIALAASAPAQSFVHPGGLHTQADLDRMKAKVAAREHPWIDGWNMLIEDRKAQANYKAAPQSHMGSRQRAQDDANAAYLNGLRWHISGDTAHADCAVRIFNAWSETVNEIPHGSDQPGLSGIPIGTFAIAAELLRSYSGWSAADQARFKRMLLDYFYPVCHDFLTRHNGRCDSAYWANWDTCNMRAIMAIGVFCDDRAKFNEAVEYFKYGRGTGSISNAAPYRFEGGLVQWQESGRDYAHVMGGQGLLMEMCQIAWNQGLDLFSYDNNRLLGAAEHTAQYTLWKGVPYSYYNNCDNANQFYISENYHGRLDASHFELVYNHYVVRQGLKAPHVKLLAALRRPEPGEIDVLGYGTLTYTLDAKASPLPSHAPPTPREVTATPGLQRVELKWPPSGAYTAHGYEVSRATAPDGPFTPIYSTTRWTTPSYMDTAVEPDRTYYYTVAALNNAGKSAASAIVSAVPAKGDALPPASQRVSAQDTLFSEAAGNSFIVPASGRELDGSFAGQQVDDDFCVTARLLDWQGSVGMMGLTIREPGVDKPRIMAVTLGEVGGRLARFRTQVDGKITVQAGCDYTWLPVWLRLQRVGNQFTAYQSSDGIEWFKIGQSTVALPRSVLAGVLASTGGTPPGRKATDPAKGVFDHVTIERNPPAAPPAPATLTATALDDGVVRLDWKNASPTSQTGVKVEASLDGAPFYEIADLPAGALRFENTGIERPTALRYRVRAYNTGGFSAYSNIAQCSKPPTAQSNTPSKAPNTWGDWPRWGDQGDGTYRNPVLPSDYSDIDCIRVGADYYAVSSTFQYSPGMVILHSKDLVNWRILSHVIEDVTQIGPELNWNRMNRYGRGVWAGAIRYHVGKFWVYFGTPDEGYFMSTAKDPAGPWEPLHCVMNEAGWDDCCPFWDDDGQGYFVGTHFKDGYKTWLFKLTADGRDLVPGWRVLLNEGSGREANKLYKINGVYYHFYSEHKPGVGRYVMMQRATNIAGPYTEKRQISHAQPEVHEPNQGGIVQTEEGNWCFFTHHGTGDWEGRCASLLPITWVDGWPVLGEVGSDGIGRMVWSGRKPVSGTAMVTPQTDDDFDGSKLGAQWEWNYQPRADKWSLSERPGFLRLHAFKPLERDNLKKAGNTLTQRSLRTSTNVVTVALDLSGMADGQVAGLCHYSKDVSTISVRRQHGILTLESARNQTVTKGPVLNVPKLWLRSTWGLDGKSSYFYSTNGTSFTPFGESYQLGWGDYRGDRIGIFTYNNEAEAGHVDVDSFTYSYRFGPDSK